MPDRYRIRIMPEASFDLMGISEFIEQDSPKNAASVIEGLIRAIDALEQFPHQYKVHRSYKDANRIVRSMPVAPFVVYYRIKEPHRSVEVLPVRHGRRRQPNRF